MSSFQVFKDEENAGAANKIAKNVLGAGGQPSRRPVLGLINQNNKQQQGKQVLKAKSENIQQVTADPKPRKVFPVFERPARKPATLQQPKPTSTFVIHEDDAKSKEDVSTDISHLHIPDSNDGLQEEEEEEDHDMSVDSFSFSPMSIDKSHVNRRLKNQEVLEHLYNVEEYDLDIYQYMKTSELKNRPKPTYMRKQPDITYSMRSILVDWLVEVADEYNLQTETLFLAVSFIDRFLSYMSVVRGKLQLVGTAAMFIASKFEEIYPPDVGEFVYITDDTYTKKQVLRMEHLILRVLTFEMSTPTIIRFATKYTLASESPTNVQHLAQYLCELSMLDAENFLHFLPSEVATAATALARHTLNLEPWPESLQKLTGKTVSELLPCLSHLTNSFENAATYPQQAVREKFSSSKWSCVSKLSPRNPHLRFEITRSGEEKTPDSKPAGESKK